MAEDLIRRLRQGDQAALRQIYEMYKDDLLTMAACLLADSSAAEDVLHDIFVELASSQLKLYAIRNLKAYLVACAANRARDRLRSPIRREKGLSEARETAAVDPDPLSSLIADEESQRLYQALSRLPYEQREVVTLHLHGGMTFREIARLVEVGQNTVQSRYRYGIDKLRSLVEESNQSCVPQKR